MYKYRKMAKDSSRAGAMTVPEVYSMTVQDVCSYI